MFEKLDRWIESENLERRERGSPVLGKCKIKVVGQTALIEANLSLHIPATMDVDVFANYEYAVKKKFEELLREIGKELDPAGQEAWMPSETVYADFFIGKWVCAYLASAECVLISKAVKSPVKNKQLIVEYLGSSPAQLFFDLAQKYKVNLDWFLK